MKKDITYKQQSLQQDAFDELKRRLTIAPILAYPNFKYSFILATDASYYRYSATLSQLGNDEKEHPIAYASKSLQKEEMNYGATNQNVLLQYRQLNIFINIWELQSLS